jgi:hypothetical protein
MKIEGRKNIPPRLSDYWPGKIAGDCTGNWEIY